VFREENDRYWAKINEDRARRAERARAARAAEEDDKKHAIASRLLEEASDPAYQVQIEDCQTLIDYFAGKQSGTTPTLPISKAEHADEPKHDIRVVETGPQEGFTAIKRTEESYFVGGKNKKTKKGGAVKAASSAEGSGNLNIPLPTLSALLSLSIPPPMSNADIPRVVDDLKTKKAWFVANQERATADAIAKAKATIERLTNGRGSETTHGSTDELAATPATVGGPEITPPPTEDSR